MCSYFYTLNNHVGVYCLIKQNDGYIVNGHVRQLRFDTFDRCHCNNLKLYGFVFFFRVLVGAPEAQSRNQPSTVRQGGAVFKCRIDGDDSCEEVPFDKDGKHIKLIRPSPKTGQITRLLRYTPCCKRKNTRQNANYST